MSALPDEWRLVQRDTAFRWLCIILAGLTVLCLWNGARFAAERNADAASEVTRSIDKRAADAKTLIAEERGSAPVNPWGPSEPTKAEWNATRPAGPLAALSFGREDLQPLSAKVSLWFVRPDNLFKKYEFDSPLSLAAGRFDAGFLLVLILPLLALALTYNVVADERESGRLRLALVTGSNIGRHLRQRMLLRLAPLYACIIMVGLVASIAGAPLGRILLWTGSGLLYLMFWHGIALGLAAVRYRAEVVALLAAATWLLVVVLLPAAGSALVQATSPTPSSFDLINSARAAEVAANRRLMENLEGYVSDHPELASADLNEDDWSAKLYASQQVIEAEIAPLVAEQGKTLDQQTQRSAALRFLSPTSAVDHLLTAAAGTGVARQRAYVDQVTAFLTRWREELAPMIFRKERLAATDIATLPRFEFREPDVPVRSTGLSLLYLAVLALNALWLGSRRLNRSIELG